MKQPGSIKLFQYWNSLRGNRSAPIQSDINPADIGSLLKDTFILETNSLQQIHFRLAGTRLCLFYGRELKGSRFKELWIDHQAETINRLFHHSFSDISPIILHYNGVTKAGKETRFELLILPFLCTEGVQRCIGIIQPVLDTYWLGSDPVIKNSLISFSMVNPETHPARRDTSPRSSAVSKLAPEITPQLECIEAIGNNPAIRRIRHLAVIDGGRSD